MPVILDSQQPTARLLEPLELFRDARRNNRVHVLEKSVLSSPGDKRVRDLNAEEGGREGILFQATCWVFKSEPCVLDQSTSLRLCCAEESYNQTVFTVYLMQKC